VSSAVRRNGKPPNSAHIDDPVLFVHSVALIISLAGSKPTLLCSECLATKC
jgi:hypothetical protein